MGYCNTFIRVAPDCPAAEGIVPKPRGDKKTLALIQYELIAHSPYSYTQDDVLWEGYVRQKVIPAEAASNEAREEYLHQPHACLRASPLVKTYGWGLHFNEEGKVALYSVSSEAYQHFAALTENLEIIDGFRNTRKGNPTKPSGRIS